MNNLLAQSNDFFTIFLSIVIEAFPFLIIGIVISSLIAKFELGKIIQKFMPSNKLLAYLYISMLGVFLPVCECGNIPVARQLLKRGFKVSQVMTFLLAAPIINPITLWSTYEAFKGDSSVVIYRFVGALFISISIGLLISTKENEKEFLNDKFEESCSHDHNDEKSFFNNFASEFTEMMKMLLVGAFIASISQIFIPREIIIAIGSSPFLSIVAMITLAFVISICSNVDAFFALSYANSFTIGSIISFLVFGPMIDIKVLNMLRSTFKIKFIIQISVLVTLMSIAAGLIVNYLN